MNPIFPLLAIVIAWLFAGQLGRQYLQRRRAHALAWSISLFLFGLGHVGVLIGITAGWSPGVFGMYWLAGALLNVPMLAVGQLHLMDAKRSVLWWTLGGLAVVWNVAFTLMATYDGAALAAAAGGVPTGAAVIGGEGPQALASSTAYGLLRPMTYTFAIVVLGCAWSAFRMKRWALLLIALGTTVAAAGSGVIGSDVDYLFPVLSAVGVGVMYLGFRVVTGPARTPAPATAASTA
jgi:hypothetical protein